MEKQAQILREAKTHQPCPICSSSHQHQVLEINNIPVLPNALWETRSGALSAPRGHIRLSFCPTCGHVYNSAFDPAVMEYDMQYENSLHFSPLFQKYAHWLAHYLIDKYQIRGKSIIEIGSGKGDFLRMLCDYGGNTGTGFDPSYHPDPNGTHPALSFVNDFYSEQYAENQADLILSRHVLEHIYQPAAFMQSLRRTTGDRNDTVIFFEVPNFAYILRDNAVWDIIYEHVSYFNPQSLAYLFARSGFNILNIADAFDRQFLYIEAVPGEINEFSSDPAGTQVIGDFSSQVAGFSARSQEKITRWNEQLAGFRASGKRAVLWGAGSKGISFLNMVHTENAVEYIVDINPRKHGKFITGAGQQIVPPSFLTDYRPETIIIMNPIYKDEIRGMTEQLGLQVEFLNAS